MQSATVINDHTFIMKVRTAILLAFIGGMVDADSFWFHGGVFASLQSGNLILLGINIARGHWVGVWHGLVPLLIFFLAVGVTRIIQQTISVRSLRQWIRITIAVESLLIILSATLNFLPNIVIKSGLSAVSGIQLQSFRNIDGVTFNSTMMTGNIRACAAFLFGGLWQHDWVVVNQGLKLLGIFSGFCIGAVTLVFLSDQFGQLSLLLAVIVLIIILVDLLSTHLTDLTEK